MADPERFLTHLAAAIRIPTVGLDDGPPPHPDALESFGRFLESTYPATWDRLDVEEVAGHSRLLTWGGTDTEAAPVLLMAHSDVVPVEDETTWNRPPFAAERSETHLVGRGALDDKGSLIAILEAVEWLVTKGFVPVRTLLIALGHDEETGGSEGAAAIADVLGERDTRLHLVLDEGGFVTERVLPGTRSPLALVGIAEKGMLTVELSATGQTGHSSAPPPHTAVGKVAAAVASLEAHPFPARTDIQRPFFIAAAPSMRRPLGWVFRRLASVSPLVTRLFRRRPTTDALIRTTTAATMISGGVKSNVLPNHATAIVNFRIMPGDSVGTVLDHVGRHTGDDVVTRSLPGATEPSPVSDVSSDQYRLVAATVAEVFPTAVVAPWVVVGMTDSRYFCRLSDHVFRFTPFRVTPDEITGFHGVDERIRLEDAAPAVEFYRRLVERACG